MIQDTGRLSAALANRYRIERELGRGGMATVYLAEDLKHRRKVALKVLNPELAAVIGGERFLKEIEVTAGLQHPQILPLHDSGEADSFLFYVMPYVEGESLRARLDREGQLGIPEATELTRQVASALDYAHRRGVIHRDIKPENILLHEGQALVADFGIALAVSTAGGSRLTGTGLSLGTPAYMSPEQASGTRELDSRSDIYALGVVLYEMLAGEPPFTGPTAQAIVTRALTEEPRPLAKVRATVSPALAAVVARAMARSPADRFGSMAELTAALLDAGRPASASRATGIRRALLAAVLVLVVATTGFLLWRNAGHQEGDGLSSLAVLPFVVAGGDTADAYLGDGLAEELLDALGEVSGLRVAARASAFALRAETLDVRQVGKRLNVDAVLDGSVRRAGNRLRISVRLADARTGYQLWRESFERERANLFQLQDEIAQAVVRRFQLELRTDALPRGRTTDQEAHDLVLRARYAARDNSREGLEQGMRLVRAALARDSGYAEAWSRLSLIHHNIAIFEDTGFTSLRLARDAAERALARDSVSADAHLALGVARFRHDWDWPAAERHLRRSIGLNPSLAEAHRSYSRFLRSMGRFEEARKELGMEAALDPLSGAGDPTAYGRISFFAGDFERALRETLSDPDPSGRARPAWLAQTLIHLGRYAEAEQLARLPETGRMGTLLRAQIAARQGRRDEARRLLAAAPSALVVVRAGVHATLGDADSAIALLERAYQVRDPLMVDLKVDPSFDPIRSDPRFAALMRRMGF